MNLIFLLIFGLIFSLIIFGYLKPEFVFPNTTYIYLKDGKISTSRRTTYFVFIMFAVTFFLLISSFQYINTADYARWPIGGWSNDMSRYWFGFHDAEGISLRMFLLTQGQEPLYIMSIWFMRKITSHFSVVLLVAYMFVFVSCLQFLKDFVLFRCVVPQNKSFAEQPFAFTTFSFFCLFYSFILTSFCLFRMGLAVAFSLYTYRYLLKENYVKAYVSVFIACGFHFSAAFLFPVCIFYKIYQSKKFKFSFFIFLFFILFAIGMLGAKAIPSIMSVLANGRYTTYTNDGLAVNTYLTNFLLLLMIFYKRKEFLRMKQDSLYFVVMLSSFFILDLQLMLSIFYRMIMFTVPMTMLAIPRLWCVYKLKRNGMLVSVCARSTLIFYLFFKLYKFCATGWESYGLNAYRLFYFY